MALIKCPSCGADMSDAAAVCPKCGAYYEKPTYCVDCNSLVKCTDEFCPNCGAPNPHFIQPVTPINTPQQSSIQVTPSTPLVGTRPDNYLTLAILSTIFCCLPTGIIAIMKANRVNEYWDRGDALGAKEESDDALKWSIFGILFFVLSWIFYFSLISAGVVDSIW